MALTITGSEVCAWTAVAQNAVTDSGVIDLSGSYASHLTIDLGTTEDGVVHNGTRVVVEVCLHASGTEFWSPLLDYVALYGTANGEAVTDDPSIAAGQVEVAVASTTGYTPALADGGSQLVFLKDATLGNSELCRVVKVASDSKIEVDQLLARTHVKTTSIFYSVADSKTIAIPFGILRAKVLIDNAYDINGATIAARVHKTITTALT